jgi:hypothetical protein
LSVPHDVPSVVLPDSMQTAAPVLQAIVPERQGFVATVHIDPAMHATHVPAELQTLSCPQDAPGGTAIPVSLQAGVAVEQSSLPAWHALVGVHASPVTHGLHRPSWQTSPAPQVAPFGLLSVSVQTGAPVEQTMVPTRHGLLATSHIVPAAQAWQTPSKQTPLSHGVPLV